MIKDRITKTNATMEERFKVQLNCYKVNPVLVYTHTVLLYTDDASIC